MNNQTLGADGRSIPVKFATGESLEQSKRYFETTYEGELPLVKHPSNLVPESDEPWEEVARFDASREVKGNFWNGTKDAVIEPSLLGWKPDGSEIVTVCGSRGIMRCWIEHHRTREDPGQPSPCHRYYDEAAKGLTDCDHMFLSSGGAVLVLSGYQSGSFMATMHLRLGDCPVGYIENLTLKYSFGREYEQKNYRLSRTGGFSPWRPDSKEILVTDHSYDKLILIDLSSVPGASRALKELPCREIDLASVFSEGSRVMRYAWHPSGKYVAVTTEDVARVRQVHIIRADDAEIVYSTLPSTCGFGWSPGGQMLLLKKWDDEADINQSSAWAEAEYAGRNLMVWDSHAWQVREITDEERDKYWTRQLVFANTKYHYPLQIWSADGERVMSAGWHSILSKNGGVECAPLPNVSYAAWSPTDPHCFATVGGDDAPHSLRIWRLRNDEA